MYFFFYILPILLFGPTSVSGQQDFLSNAQDSILVDDNLIHRFVKKGIEINGEADLSIKSYKLDKLGFERLALLKALVDEYPNLTIDLFLDVHKGDPDYNNGKKELFSTDGKKNMVRYRWMIAIKNLYGQSKLFEFIEKKARYFDLPIRDIAYNMGLNIDQIQDLMETEGFESQIEIILLKGDGLPNDKVIFSGIIKLVDPFASSGSAVTQSCGGNWYLGCEKDGDENAFFPDNVDEAYVIDLITQVASITGCYECYASANIMVGSASTGVGAPIAGVAMLFTFATCTSCLDYLYEHEYVPLAEELKQFQDKALRKRWESCTNEQFKNACGDGKMCVATIQTHHYPSASTPEKQFYVALGTPYCADCPELKLTGSMAGTGFPSATFSSPGDFTKTTEDENGNTIIDTYKMTGALGGVKALVVITKKNGTSFAAHGNTNPSGLNENFDLFSGFDNDAFLDKLEHGDKVCVYPRGTSSFRSCSGKEGTCFDIICPEISFIQSGNTVTISEEVGSGGSEIVLPWIPSSSTSNGEYTTNSNNPKSITYTFDKDNLPINKDNGKRCVYLGVQIRGKGCGNLNATFCFTDCDFLEPTVTCANYQEDDGAITIDDGYKFELYSDGEPQGSSNGNTMENIPGNSCFIIDIYHESANPAEDEPCRSMEVFVGGEDCTGICPPSCEEYNKSDIHDDSSTERYNACSYDIHIYGETGIGNSPNSGYINLSIDGPNPPYDFDWKDIHGTNDSQNRFEIEAGTYCVIVSDASCCSKTACFEVPTVCADCKITGEVTNSICGIGGAISTQILCPSGDDPESNMNWVYNWSNGATGSSITDLNPGTYTVSLTSSEYDCTLIGMWTVEDDQESISIRLSQLTNTQFCPLAGEPRNCTGTISIEVGEGTTIEWQNLENPSETNNTTITDLCLGTYTVIVTKNGCSNTKSFRVDCCESDPHGEGDGDPETIWDPLSVESEVSPSQNGEATGAICLTISGGKTAPVIDNSYNIYWSGPNGFTAEVNCISGLLPGIYCVEIFNGCDEYSECFEIVNCAEQTIHVNGVVTNTCDGYCVGSIVSWPWGTTGPYNYEWSNGSSSNAISGLCQNTSYTVTVTDGHGCTEVGSYTVGVNETINLVSKSQCGWDVYCNDSKVDFIPYTGNLNCGWDNCNDWVCDCPLKRY